jgi:imidazolonepropionase-like amidohydrolase
MHAHYSQIEYGPAYLASGVTTARDLGGEFEFLAAMRAKVESRGGVSPRLLLAGIVDGEGPTRFGVNSASTPEQARAIVARYKNAGFSQIKIYSLITPEILRILTAEAHRNGMTVTGHIPRGMNLMDVIDAGMDEVCHMGGVAAFLRDGGDAALQTLKQRGVGFDTTFAWGELQGRPKNIPMSSFEPGMAKAPYSLTSIINSAGGADAPVYRPEERYRNQVATVRRLLDAGIPVVPGTDKAVPGHSLLRELELYVAGGMEPGEVIRIATSGSARAMKLDQETGTIQTGKRADIVMLDGNPLEDFRNIRKINRVITNGRVYDPAKLWQSVGFRP